MPDNTCHALSQHGYPPELSTTSQTRPPMLGKIPPVSRNSTSPWSRTTTLFRRRHIRKRDIDRIGCGMSSLLILCCWQMLLRHVLFNGHHRRPVSLRQPISQDLFEVIMSPDPTPSHSTVDRMSPDKSIQRIIAPLFSRLALCWHGLPPASTVSTFDARSPRTRHNPCDGSVLSGRESRAGYGT